ncbi:carboxypeptidase-like regulatory domain-containing protein [Rhodopirellula bahusiensis]|uniref:carboxypeptidase-like regulatory domain-containing protein n=1 Tax=Rhodopirellula bahusiensis TaxID=2014065 RepID=UPI001304445C|nr:carboxypeptidase-like regulatory domain-containing protein [Rhodopirellula bahusiensis]
MTVPSVGNEHERTWLLGTSVGIPDAYFQWNLRSVAMFYGKAIEMPDREDLEKDLVIRLPKPSTDLRIISAEGAPQPNVTITPTQLVWFARELTPDDNNDHGAIRKRIGVPQVLRASLARTTDADGRVSFSTIDRMEFAELECESPDHGLQRSFTNNNTIGKELQNDLVIYPVGSVSGVVRVPNGVDPDALNATELLFETSGFRRPKNATLSMQGVAKVRLDQSGTFHLPAMAAGKFKLVDRFGEEAKVRITLPKKATVSPGEELKLDCKAIKMVLVRSRYVYRESGEPAASKSVKINHGRDAGVSRELAVYTKTDANGRFQARVFPGTIGYESLTVVDGFNQAHRFEQPRNLQLPQGKRTMVPIDSTTCDLEPLELIPTRLVRGKLIDQDGDPLANVGVYAWNRFQTSNDFSRTNEEGEFTLERMPSAYPPKQFKVGPQYKTKRAMVVSDDPLVIQLKSDLPSE